MCHSGWMAGAFSCGKQGSLLFHDWVWEHQDFGVLFWVYVVTRTLSQCLSDSWKASPPRFICLQTGDDPVLLLGDASEKLDAPSITPEVLKLKSQGFSVDHPGSPGEKMGLSSCHCRQIPETEGLKHLSIFSQFWRLNV